MRNEGSQAHQGFPMPKHQCWEEESTKQLSLTISGNSVWVRWAAVDTGILLQGLHTDSLAHNTNSKLQQRDSSSKSPRTDRKELNCVTSGQGLEREHHPGLSTGRCHFPFVKLSFTSPHSQQEQVQVLAGTTVFFLSPLTTQSARKDGCQICLH